jgi:hypothetical protein
MWRVPEIVVRNATAKLLDEAGELDHQRMKVFGQHTDCLLSTEQIDRFMRYFD